jgi:UDP-N-acetylglucosamine--N-acetylmuramyl-(pentapeptide) pyrophosphoryl-undecaprenol N-acetylglucosamine transferase
MNAPADHRAAPPAPQPAAPVAVVMAGGTGGHIFPGLAVAQALRAAGWSVFWMGAPGSMEAELVPQHGFAMLWVRFGGLRGKGLAAKLLLPLNLLRAFWQALRALRRVQADVVVSMGGYIAFPGGLMSVWAGARLVVHEQNAVAGLANKVLARLADRVYTAFPGALPGGQWVGNPVRAPICALPAPELRYAGRSGPLRLLVIGGSLGAAALNTLVPQALALLPVEQRPLVRHQSGSRHLAALQQAYASAGVQAECVAFIDDMAAAYAQADLLICRAGASTVTEVACAGVAAVFVPFPYAVDDHQTANARFLADRGAALLVQQRDIDAAALAGLLRGLDRQRLLALAQAARALARPDAVQQVVDGCTALLPGGATWQGQGR